MPGNAAQAMSSETNRVKCIVHRFPNGFRIADSAWAKVVLNQGKLATVVRYSQLARWISSFQPV
jgi:hypothetical protein